MSFIKPRSGIGAAINLRVDYLASVRRKNIRIAKEPHPDMFCPLWVSVPYPEVSITFCFLNGESEKWLYETEEERDLDYDWILKQLDCKTNEDG